MLLRKILILFLTSSIPNNWVLADEVVPIKKNDPSPIDGFVITQQHANNIKVLAQERDGYKLLNDSFQNSLKLQENIINSQDNKVNLLIGQNEKLAKSLYDERTMTNWERVGWFTLGIIATGFAIYAVKEITTK